ncbi:MAG: WD40/YVTN/BNR-like repeat-containing protein [Bacteroidales bacterium]
MKTFLSCCKNSTKRASLIVIICLAANFTYAQFPNQHLDNFWEICRLNDHYYDSLINIYGIDSIEESGYTLFERWKHEWQPIIPPDGSMIEAMLKKQEIQNNADAFNESHRNSMYSSDWKELGPSSTPGTGTTDMGDVGRLATVYIDPADTKSIFVGSPLGGLFFSHDGGAKFQNGGTDNIRFPNGVCSIVITTIEAAKYWFIATGNKDNNFSYSGGIYRSTNEGKDWVRISNGFPSLTDNALYRINKLIAHPTDPNIMIAAVTCNSNNCEIGGIYITNNALADEPVWIKVKGGQYYDLEFRPDPDNIYSEERLYASADVNEYNNFSSEQFPLLMYTDNLGENWTSINLEDILPTIPPPTCPLRISVETTIAAPDNLYIYLVYGVSDGHSAGTGHGKFARLVSGSALDTLSSVTSVMPGWDGFAVSPLNTNIMYYGGVILRLNDFAKS